MSTPCVFTGTDGYTYAIADTAADAATLITEDQRIATDPEEFHPVPERHMTLVRELTSSAWSTYRGDDHAVCEIVQAHAGARLWVMY